MAQMGIISPIQGKLDAAICRNKDATPEQISVIEQNAKALHDLLSGASSELDFAVEPLNVDAQSYNGESGPIEIVGGCNFHVIESARTPFQLDAKGKYLAVEGPEEQCSVKETLEKLQHEGMLDGVKGIFLGYIAGYNHQAGESEEKRNAVDAKRAEVKEAAENIGIPIFTGMPWGHIPAVGSQKDVYLPLHTDATFAGSTLTVNAVRSRENLDAAQKSYSEKRSQFASPSREVAGDSVLTSMEEMKQSLFPPNLRRKDVTLAFTPKFGEAVTHMMEVGQGLSALLHKGSLAGINSLTLDLSGLYDDSDGKPFYRNLQGNSITPPHGYNDQRIVDAIKNPTDYKSEINGYLADFSQQHLGGIRVEAGFDKVVEKIAAETGISEADLKASHQKSDGTGRVDATAMAQNYNEGKIQSRSSQIGAGEKGVMK